MKNIKSFLGFLNEDIMNTTKGVKDDPKLIAEFSKKHTFFADIYKMVKDMGFRSNCIIDIPKEPGMSAFAGLEIYKPDGFADYKPVGVPEAYVSIYFRTPGKESKYRTTMHDKQEVEISTDQIEPNRFRDIMKRFNVKDTGGFPNEKGGVVGRDNYSPFEDRLGETGPLPNDLNIVKQIVKAFLTGE